MGDPRDDLRERREKHKCRQFVQEAVDDFGHFYQHQSPIFFGRAARYIRKPRAAIEPNGQQSGHRLVDESGAEIQRLAKVVHYMQLELVGFAVLFLIRVVLEDAVLVLG